jgi:hypothetical protein
LYWEDWPNHDLRLLERIYAILWYTANEIVFEGRQRISIIMDYGAGGEMLTRLITES